MRISRFTPLPPWLGALTAMLLLVQASFAAVGATRMVSRTPAGTPALTGAQLNPTVGEASMSADGRYVAFVTNALNFGVGLNGKYQVYVRDRVTGSVELVSRSTAGEIANGDCLTALISPDGTQVAFSSDAANLVASDWNAHTDVFLHQRASGVTQRLSVGPNGREGNDNSFGPFAWSADGRYVAYGTLAENLAAGEFTSRGQLLLRDLAQQTNELVVLPNDGSTPNGGYSGNRVGISANGRYVAFESSARNLVVGDTNGEQDVFVRDRELRTTTRVSVSATGAQAQLGGTSPSISADGRYVAFVSRSTDLVPGTAPIPLFRVFVADRVTGALELGGVSASGEAAFTDCLLPVLSPDGRYLTFNTTSSNLTATDANGSIADVFRRDRSTGEVVPLSLSSTGEAGNGDSGGRTFRAAFSADGRYVLFNSDATNFTIGDHNGRTDAFLRDLQAGTTERVNVGPAGVEGIAGAHSSSPAVSADGRYVAFVSDAVNLVSDDTNEKDDVFVWDRTTGTIERASLSSSGEQADQHSATPAISGDGRFVAFASAATNLVAGTYSSSSVFVRDRQNGTTECVSLSSFSFDPQLGSRPSISADGRYVAFVSAQRLAWGDNNVFEDVFVRDRQANTTEQISVGPSGTQPNRDLEPGTRPAISGDGSKVAFVSTATNLISGGTSGTNLFVRTRVLGPTVRIPGGGREPALSYDGRFVASTTTGSAGSGYDLNGIPDVVVYDQLQQTIELVSVLPGGDTASGGEGPAISGDGRYVTFVSNASFALLGDGNGVADVFVRDRLNRATTRVSVAADGGTANGSSGPTTAISSDGTLVAFSSLAGNLTPDDTNGSQDMFVRAVQSGQLPPTNLTATALSSSAVRLSWTDPGDSEEGFRIFRRLPGQRFVFLTSVGANVTTYDDPSVAPNKQYYYSVLAVGSGGASDYSNGMGAISLPAQPTSLHTTAVSNTQVSLAWDANAPPNDPFVFAFKLERSTNGGSFSEIAQTPYTEPRYQDTGLTPGVEYAYRVRASNPSGASSYSSTLTVRTIPNAPAAPTNLTAQVYNESRLDLAWVDANDNESGFRLERFNPDGTSRVISLGANVRQYSDTGLSPKSAYRYELRTTNAGGSSAVTSVGPITTPAAPRGRLSVPGLLYFGAVRRGTTVTLRLPIRNLSGTESLRVSVGALPAPFTLIGGATEFDLAPGQVREVEVRFAPVAAGAAVADLKLRSSDPNAANVSVQCTGTGR